MWSESCGHAGRVTRCLTVNFLCVVRWLKRFFLLLLSWQVITVKNKYLILNATGLEIEYKQKGTPDPALTVYGTGTRFSNRLTNNWRAAWHWDNAYADQELMIRPAGDDWEWSGKLATWPACPRRMAQF